MRQQINKRFNEKEIIFLSLAIFFALLFTVTCVYFFNQKDDTSSSDSTNNFNVTIDTVTYEDEASIPTGYPSTETREKAFSSSVMIEIPLTSSTYYGSGSIFMEDEEYTYILTCHHVIEVASANNIYITLYDGTTTRATFVGADTSSDVAILKFEGTGYQKITSISSNSDLSSGQSVFAVGYSLGLYDFTYNFGSLSQSKERTITIDGLTLTALQIDAAINGGMSGGGVFDANGNFIGMIVGGYDSQDAQNVNFILPAYDVIQTAITLLSNMDASTGVGYIPGQYNLGLTIGTFGAQSTYPIVMEIPQESTFYGTDKSTSLQLYDILKSVKIGDGAVHDLSTYSDVISIFNSEEVEVGTEIVFVVAENYGIDDIERTVTITVKQYIFTL